MRVIRRCVKRYWACNNENTLTKEAVKGIILSPFTAFYIHIINNKVSVIYTFNPSLFIK